MLALPDAELDVEDNELLADWVDACALLSPTGVVSQGDVFDVLMDSGLIEPPRPARRRPHGEDRTTLQDTVGERVEDVWRALRSRKRRLDGAYPFSISSDSMTRTGTTWEASRCFALLLFADLGKKYESVGVDFEPGSDFCRLFEHVVQACESTMFRSAAVRFGHPPDDDWPISVRERIEELALRFDRQTDNIEEKIHGRDKDLGLDVAARFSFGDGLEGGLVLLTQCATGQNWTSKHEPSLEEWAALIRWNARLVRAIAFPWRMQSRPYLWRDALRLEAVLLDRMRLLSLDANPDSKLSDAVKPDIDAWCSARAGEFPRLT